MAISLKLHPHSRYQHLNIMIVILPSLLGEFHTAARAGCQVITGSEVQFAPSCAGGCCTSAQESKSPDLDAHARAVLRKLQPGDFRCSSSGCVWKIGRIIIAMRAGCGSLLGDREATYDADLPAVFTDCDNKGLDPNTCSR